MLKQDVRRAVFAFQVSRHLAIVGTCFLFNWAVLPDVAAADGQRHEAKVELPHGIAPMSASALSEQHAMGVDQEIAVSPVSERDTAVILFDEAGGGGPVKFGYAASTGGAQTTVNGQAGSQ
ncbi:MAG: hypothetical protein ACFCUQ_13245 [Kiloniellales bacterium]